MFKHAHLVRSTLAAALVSTAAFGPSAHAGLLGGGGGLAGGFGGGLNGSFAPRSFDLGGQAHGNVTRPVVGMPRGDRVLQKTAETAQKGDGAPHAATTSAAATNASTMGQVGTASGMASTGGEVSRGATRFATGAGAALAGGAVTMPSTMGGNSTSVPSRSVALPTGGSGTTALDSDSAVSSRSANTAVSGGAHGARAGRSLSADASAQGNAKR